MFILEILVEDERIENVYCIRAVERQDHEPPRKTSVESDKLVIFRAHLWRATRSPKTVSPVTLVSSSWTTSVRRSTHSS